MIDSQVLLGFSTSLLSKNFDGAVKHPPFHLDLWDLCCSPDKFVAGAAPRGHAKSTAVTLVYTLAKILFEESSFVLIVSDTERQASMFVQNIRNEIAENKNLIELFGIRQNQKKETYFETDNETDIIFKRRDGSKIRVVAKGATQPLRGLLWFGKRPDLVIIDDVENDELVMNKERRDKLRRWIYGAVIPMMSPAGILRIVGTILHSDSFLESVMPEAWSKDTRVDGLKMWSVKKTLWKAVKWRAHSGNFDLILWPERFDKEFFVERRDEFTRQGIPDTYSQEYLNEPIDDSIAYFKKADFVKETDNPDSLHFYITADLAISKEDTADYTVFVVGAIDSNRKLRIKQVIKERLDGREIVDMILRLHNIYKPEAFGIEEMQVSKAIGPFLNEEMHRTNTYPNLVKLSHGNKDKIARARSIQARMRAKSVLFDTEADWFDDFQDELIKFPRARHDDQVDAFAYQGVLLDRMFEAPTAEEIEDEKYEEELNEGNQRYVGQSSTTGY